MNGLTATEVYGNGGLTATQIAAQVASSGLKVTGGAAIGPLAVSGGGGYQVSLRDDPVLWVVVIVGLAAVLAWASAR